MQPDCFGLYLFNEGWPHCKKAVYRPMHPCVAGVKVTGEGELQGVGEGQEGAHPAARPHRDSSRAMAGHCTLLLALYG